jgi:hypothetical protein
MVKYYTDRGTAELSRRINKSEATCVEAPHIPKMVSDTAAFFPAQIAAMNNTMSDSPVKAIPRCLLTILYRELP